MALQPAADGTDVAITVIAPFGLSLSQPITIDLAETRLLNVPFQTCMPSGCIATATADATAMERLLAGTDAVVDMTAINGQTLRLQLPLAGFAAAWSRLLDLVRS
jgi:invasion protein IalB